MDQINKMLKVRLPGQVLKYACPVVLIHLPINMTQQTRHPGINCVSVCLSGNYSIGILDQIHASCFRHLCFNDPPPCAIWSSGPFPGRSPFKKPFKDLLEMFSISRRSTWPKYIGCYTVSNIFTYKL